VQTEQYLVQAATVALRRLFAARLDPERRLVVVAVRSHIVQHQLRLARPAESPHHERPSVAVCGIVSELRVYLVVQRASWNECLDWLERRVRVREMACNIGSKRCCEICALRMHTLQVRPTKLPWKTDLPVPVQ
jgi:hypothetical protein